MPFADPASSIKYREDCRVLIRAAKNKPCADCGVSYPFYVMDFDHRPGEKKLFIINRMPGRHGPARILAEIAKCDVICSNCHRERTFNRSKAMADMLV